MSGRYLVIYTGRYGRTSHEHSSKSDALAAADALRPDFPDVYVTEFKNGRCRKVRRWW